MMEEYAGNVVKVKGKNVHRTTLDTLLGKRGAAPEAKEVTDDIAVLAQVLDDPSQFPFLLEKINKFEREEPLRLALVRAQVDSHLRMREDMENYGNRYYVAQSIEKMLFGGLLLEGDGGDDEEEEEDE